MYNKNFTKVALFIILVSLILGYVTFREFQSLPVGSCAINVDVKGSGLLKIFLEKDGALIDAGNEIKFTHGVLGRNLVVPLWPGSYKMVGFKPFLEGGEIKINNITIFHEGGDSFALEGNIFSEINDINSVIAPRIFIPKQDAKDPFFVCHGFEINLVGKIFDGQEFLRIITKNILSLLLVVSTILFVLYFFNKKILPSCICYSFRVITPPLFGLILGFLILQAKSFHSIEFPILWAEDGTWSAMLLSKGFIYTLFHSREDYFTFFNVLLLGFANSINYLYYGSNLNNLPIFISLFASLFISAVAIVPVVIFKRYISSVYLVLYWAFFLLLPLNTSSFEVVGRISQVGYFSFPLCLYVVFWKLLNFGMSTRIRIVCEMLLAACIATNPLCIPLVFLSLVIDLIFFVPRLNEFKSKLSHRDAAKFLMPFTILFLSMAFLASVSIGIRPRKEDSFLMGSPVWSSVIEMVIGRGLLYPIIFPFYSKMSNFISVLAFGVVFLSIFVVGVYALVEKKCNWSNFLITNADLLLCKGALIGSLYCAILTFVSRPGLSNGFHNWTTTGADRYFMASNLLFLLSALMLLHHLKNKNYFYPKAISFIVTSSMALIYFANLNSILEFGTMKFEYVPGLKCAESFALFSDKQIFEEKLISQDRLVQVKIQPNNLVIHFWTADFPLRNVLSSIQGTPITAIGVSQE